MHHLCPHPRGPVRIDPQPLTFLDAPPGLSCAACSCAGVAWGVWSSALGLLLANLSTGLHGAFQICTKSWILLSLKEKVEPFRKNTRLQGAVAHENEVEVTAWSFRMFSMAYALDVNPLAVTAYAALWVCRGAL